MSLRTTMLTSAFATAVAVAACSGSNHKKVVSPPGDDAGTAGATQSEMGGEGGAPAHQPNGGEGGTETAGAGGEGGEAGAGGHVDMGEAGTGPVELPAPHLLFTVGAGAKGLIGTALAGQAQPTSVIFGSHSESPNVIAGSNEVVFSAAQLGLAASDVIDAFTVLAPIPEKPAYLFSVAGSGEKAVRPTRLNRSSLEDGAPGDVYASDAVQSYRQNGEGGDSIGYNALLFDQASLGLSAINKPPGKGKPVQLDDLTGVLLLPQAVLPTELYFSVGLGSTGLPGSAIELTDVNERGCTVYKSTLDGTNTVAYSCARLGLVSNTDIKMDVKGLAVLGSEAPSQILFTVAPPDTGNSETTVVTGIPTPNNIYESAGDGNNALFVSGVALGLKDDDALDALSVVARTAPAYDTPGECNLAPFDGQGANLANFQSAHGLGSGLILIASPPPGDSNLTGAIAAFNVKTCAFVARAEIDSSTLQAHQWTPVPLPGWSAKAPLQKLEYWTIDATGSSPIVKRLDAAGQQLNSYGFDGIPAPALGSYNVSAFDYDAPHQTFAVVLTPAQGFPDSQRVVFKLPPTDTPDDTLLSVLPTPLPHPCAGTTSFSGFDSAGNSYLAQWNRLSYSTYRVCPFLPSGEFIDLPFDVTISSNSTEWGMIVPGDAIYALFQYNGFLLAHQTLTTP